MALGIYAGVQFGPTGTKLREFLNKWYEPAKRGELYVTSAYRPEETGSHHAGLTWNGSPTAAIDLGALDFGQTIGKARMAALAKWLYDNFADQIAELIHTVTLPGTGYYVKNGVKVGPFAAADHWNHVHFATSAAMIAAMDTRAQQLFGTNNPPPVTGGPPPTPPGGQPMENGPIFGWDMSDFNNSPTSDVTASYAAGIRFFTHKLIELDSTGGHYEHTKCAARVNAARQAGIPFVGVYVVPRTGVSAQTLANEALRLLNLRLPGLKDYQGFFWQVDTEHWSYDAVSPTLGEQVCAALEALTPGRKAVHYAPKWAYGNTVPNPNRPLWASSYGNNASIAYKTHYTNSGGANHVGWQAYSGRVPKILQFGSNGIIVNGRGGDVNAFKGSTKDFATMIGWSTYGDPQ